MTDAPAVSVVCPTYNALALLRETLAAVAAQTLRDFECIVIDDGCVDATAAYLDELAAADPRFRVIHQANAGIGHARNAGMAAARGRYTALLDHDDLWLPEKLARQVDYMDARPDCIASLVPWAEVKSPASFVFDPAAVADADGYIDRPFRLFAESKLYIPSSALMFRRAAAAGLANQTARRTIEDAPFYAQLLTRGRLCFAGREILAFYRFHAGNASSDALYFANGVRHMRKMHDAGEFEPLTDQQRSDLLAWIAAFGRTAGARLVCAGMHQEAFRWMKDEFGPQLAQRRWKYLASFPVFCALPAAASRRFFAGKSHAGK